MPSENVVVTVSLIVVGEVSVVNTVLSGEGKSLII